MRFENGSILYYRVFDIGDEVNLNLADSILKQTSLSIRLVLSRRQRAVIIKEPPLVLSLGSWQYEIGGVVCTVNTFGKLWPFGAFSLLFKIVLPAGITLDRLAEIACHVDSDIGLHSLAMQKTEQLINDCKAAIKNPELSDIYEDYMIFHMESGSERHDVQKILDHDHFYSMILLDSNAAPSRQVKEELAKGVYQYTEDDFVLIDWNSAFLYEKTVTTDIPDVIEFALVQLLEMQYYDALLTKRLGTLYRAISDFESSIFSNRHAKLRRQSALFYRDISEIVETVENSLKVVGDFYYAGIFRGASAKFRFTDWKQNVDIKLKSVANVSQLLSGEINEKRNQFMEVVIIILIAFEGLPILKEYIHFFKMLIATLHGGRDALF